MTKQGTMATIDPYSIKREHLTEHRLDMLEEQVQRVSDKLNLLIAQLKIEFYKKA